MIAVSNVCWRSFGTRLPLAGLVAFSHLQFSQIRGRQPYSIVRKIPYLIKDSGHYLNLHTRRVRINAGIECSLLGENRPRRDGGNDVDGPIAVIGDAFAERHSWNVRASPTPSALMPTNLIALAHFSVSSAISLPKPAGETTSGAPPRSVSRALILGSARPALISPLSLSTISTGVA